MKNALQFVAFMVIALAFTTYLAFCDWLDARKSRRAAK